MDQKWTTIGMNAQFLTDLDVRFHTWVSNNANTDPGTDKPRQRR
jgi:hypothetical protein